MINIHTPVVNVYVTVNNPPTDLGPILERLQTMADAQQLAADDINKVGDVLDKVSTEVTSLVGDVRILKDEVAGMGTISPNLRAAIDRIASKADAIDALIDDVAPNPTGTPVPAGAPPGTQPPTTDTGGGTDTGGTTAGTGA